MKSDSEIKYQVQQALQSNRRFDAADILVAVQRGVLTLSGFSRSQFERYQAEGVARRMGRHRASERDQDEAGRQ